MKNEKRYYFSEISLKEQAELINAALKAKYLNLDEVEADLMKGKNGQELFEKANQLFDDNQKNVNDFLPVSGPVTPTPNRTPPPGAYVNNSGQIIPISSSWSIYNSQSTLIDNCPLNISISSADCNGNQTVTFVIDSDSNYRINTALEHDILRELASPSNVHAWIFLKVFVEPRNSSNQNNLGTSLLVNQIKLKAAVAVWSGGLSSTPIEVLENEEVFKVYKLE